VLFVDSAVYIQLATVCVGKEVQDNQERDGWMLSRVTLVEAHAVQAAQNSLQEKLTAVMGIS